MGGASELSKSHRAIAFRYLTASVSSTMRLWISSRIISCRVKAQLRLKPELEIGYWLLAVGDWRLANNVRRFAIGDSRSAIDGAAADTVTGCSRDRTPCRRLSTAHTDHVVCPLFVLEPSIMRNMSTEAPLVHLKNESNNFILITYTNYPCYSFELRRDLQAYTQICVGADFIDQS